MQGYVGSSEVVLKQHRVYPYKYWIGYAGYSRGYTVLLIYNTNASLELYTSYTQAVDNVLVGVYSYTQAKSYIRVEIVDNYDLWCG